MRIPVHDIITVQDIIALLPLVAYRDWEIRESGSIRQKTPTKDGTCHCPLSALAEEIKGEPTDGLDLEFFSEDDEQPPLYPIYRAADIRGVAHRRAILRALGLTETRASAKT